MKVGILVVYYLISNDNDWIFGKHLEHLARTKPCMPFKVYAAINRLPVRFQQLLRALDFVEIVTLPSSPKRGSAEHGTYLDMLAQHALADGCDYICTFDVDSWPIRDDWIQISHELLREQSAVAIAILRAENGDVVLPHPAFTFIEAKLFRDSNCRYWIDESERDSEFLRFLKARHQHGDTGSPLGFFLDSRGLPWVKLRRSNKVDFHFLMGGIYGRFVFHLGASSRRRIAFRGDDAKWLATVSPLLGSTPMLWRLGPTILKLLKSTYEPFVWRRNRRALDAIASKLKADERALYEELLGKVRN